MKELQLATMLRENGIKSPPAKFDDSFYRWLEEVESELGVQFISRSGLPPQELRELVDRQGALPEELDFYYKNSTPWDYDIEEYWKRLALAKEQCRETLINSGGLSRNAANTMIESSLPLWPIQIRSPGQSELAFFDDSIGLTVVSANSRAGSPLGRPLALGLRDFFVQSVAAQLLWYEREGEEEFTTVLMRPEILSLGHSEVVDETHHPIVRSFKLAEGS